MKLEYLATVLVRVCMALGALLVLAVFAGAVEAQTATAPAAQPAVTVPLGEWVAGVVNFIIPALGVVLMGFVTYAAKFLPATLQSYVTAQNTQAVEQLLERAITFGLNKVVGATAGDALTVPVGSQVLAEAAQYAIDHGPDKLIAWAGGEDGLREKILARLKLAPGADGGALLAAAK